MKEELISLPTAILAKEKGYSLSVTLYNDKYYNSLGELKYVSYKVNLESYELEVPTQSLLQRWLREEHGIHIGIRRSVWNGQIEYNDFVYPFGSEKHTDTTLGNEFDTFEDALENALQEALKLI